MAEPQHNPESIVYYHQSPPIIQNLMVEIDALRDRGVSYERAERRLRRQELYSGMRASIYDTAEGYVRAERAARGALRRVQGQLAGADPERRARLLRSVQDLHPPTQLAIAQIFDQIAGGELIYNAARSARAESIWYKTVLDINDPVTGQQINRPFIFPLGEYATTQEELRDVAIMAAASLFGRATTEVIQGFLEQLQEQWEIGTLIFEPL